MSRTRLRVRARKIPAVVAIQKRTGCGRCVQTDSAWACRPTLSARCLSVQNWDWMSGRRYAATKIRTRLLSRQIVGIELISCRELLATRKLLLH
jgi:hypothetical protein